MKVMEEGYDREMATALGVAVLGALISFRYRAGITPELERVAQDEDTPSLAPAELHEAGESVEATLALARRLGEQGRALVDPAKESFLNGLHLGATVSLCFAALGLVVVLIWMPREIGRHQGEEGAPRESEPEESAG